MNRTAIRFAIALSAGFLGTALATEKIDHLEPSRSAIDTRLDDHRALIIHTVFHDAWSREILLRMHGDDGGLGLEDYVITLKALNGKYSVVYFHTPHRLRRYWLPPLPLRAGSKTILPLEPRDYHDIVPERCEVAIPSQLAKRLVAAWHSVLMDARYYENEPYPPPDGGRVEFSMEYNGQTLAGTISDAVDDGSKPAQLVSIAMDMRTLCMDRPAEARTALKGDLTRFEKQYTK